MPRAFPPAVADDRVLGLFLTATTQLKAHLQLVNNEHVQQKPGVWSSVRFLAALILKRCGRSCALVRITTRCTVHGCRRRRC